MRTTIASLGSLLLLITCVNAANQSGRTRPVAQMKISSPAFADHQSIPSKYTCDGPGISPPLAFEDVPAAAKSLALVVEDPDALKETWDHWVAWNIPPGTRSLAEGQRPGGTTGRNSWARNEWGGPCPPDREHRYVFKVYALDTTLKLDESAGKAALEKTMKGHVLATGEMFGLYNRKR